MNTAFNSSGPVSLYAIFLLKPGQEKAILPELKLLSAQVKEIEKDKTLLYLAHFPRYDYPSVPEGKPPIASNPSVPPVTLVFVEKYVDWEAFKTHIDPNSPFSEFIARNMDKFILNEDGSFPATEVVYLSEVAGFTTG